MFADAIHSENTLFKKNLRLVRKRNETCSTDSAVPVKRKVQVISFTWHRHHNSKYSKKKDCKEIQRFYFSSLKEVTFTKLRLCLQYTGQLLRRPKNHTGRASLHTYEQRFRLDCRNGAKPRRAAPRRSLKWRVTYRIGIHTIQDSFSCRQEKLSVKMRT